MKSFHFESCLLSQNLSTQAPKIQYVAQRTMLKFWYYKVGKENRLNLEQC